MKKYIWIGLFLILFMMTGCRQEEDFVVQRNTESFVEPEEGIDIQENTANADEVNGKEIYVYVCGYVETPGVYSLPVEARICDAIALAGGVLEEGRPEALQQAEHMVDGQTIYVPGKDEMSSEEESQGDGLININTANREQLMTLPGIGTAKADLILQYREEQGPFETIDDLKNISGVKDGVFDKIKAYITV